MKTDREFAIDVVRRLTTAGFTAFWAGGCVRDELLGLTPADYDIATNAAPEQVIPLFRRTIAIGAAFGVIEVIGPRQVDGTHHQVQVATFRSDGIYIDGRRPESVIYSTPEQDAMRRDFTINGLFFDPLTGTIWDYVGGQADLNAKIIRAIGDPAARFTEDKLRLMRAVRMAARFEFPIEARTEQAIRQMAAQLPVVSAERIADELKKMASHPARAQAFAMLHEFGLFQAVLPDVAKRLTAEAWTATLENIKRLPKRAGFPLVLATLLQPLGDKIVPAVSKRLKLSNEEQSQTEWLLKHEAPLRLAADLPNSELYPRLCQPGMAEMVSLFQALGRDTTFLERQLATIPPEQLNPPPLITGDDLTAAGYQPGKLFKLVLQEVRDSQLNGQIHTPAEAMTLANARFAQVGT